MTSFLEDLETLRLIRAFSRIKNRDKRRLIVEFTEAAVAAEEPGARDGPDPKEPDTER